MSYFADEQVKRIELPSDKKYYVDVIDGFRWRDVKQFVSVGDAGSVNFAATADKVLAIAIKDWNLDLSDGTIAPVTPENIDRLSQSDVLFILDALNLEADPKKK